jgi:hypothetical protein
MRTTMETHHRRTPGAAQCNMVTATCIFHVCMYRCRKKNVLPVIRDFSLRLVESSRAFFQTGMLNRTYQEGRLSKYSIVEKGRTRRVLWMHRKPRSVV